LKIVAVSIGLAFAPLVLAAPALAAPRVALVIGNNRYANLPPDRQLSRAASDATAVAAKLKSMGFQVVLRIDASRFQMLQALNQATHAVDPGGAMVVYFAGHGVEIGGANYLIPSDSPAPDETSAQLLKDAAVPLETLVSDLSQAGGKTNVVILDACRDNPYRDARDRSTGAERGLERVDPPNGFFILYSAGRGQTALDRLKTDSDPNSVYTRVLLKHLADPVPLTDLAKTLQGEVAALAQSGGHAQKPAYYDQLDGRPMITGETAAERPPQPGPAAVDPLAMEMAFWTASNCAGGDLGGCRAYVDKFGTAGQFAALAALKLRPTPPPTPAAPDPNAGARAAIAGISAADWSTRSGDQVLASVLARVDLAQIKALANTGDARAQTLVGLAFDWGRGGEAQDFAQAMTWYRKAADQGNATAQFGIGRLYDNGHGVKQDYAQAMTWYRKAADQGNATAQYNIGVLYDNGHGVKQDYAQAMTWYRKAADQGYADAQNNIGFLYANGQGVKQDYAQAMTWYRKAADQGNAMAQNNLGALYDVGQGVKQDYAQAMIWYRKAADQGDEVAQRNIGDLYANGHGVPTDEAQARIWYRKAAAGGDGTAKTWLAGHRG
jgi:TPR repeat protein